MAKKENIELILQIFRAVEGRDVKRMNELTHPDIEFHWPPSLPYGGSFRGRSRSAQVPTWTETWNPFQPSETERRLDPRVVAATEEEVIVLWRQRGVSPTGKRLDSPVLGLYQIRDGKLVRAQMFYFDTAAVLNFLSEAAVKSDAAGQ
jgi:ketosteroid isomerase-like protein